MNIELLAVVLAGFFVAYCNGANDVSKGIATLVGSGVTNYRRAILWGTFCTGLGGISGALLATAMIQTFGKGLLSEATTPAFSAALATIVGASAFVALATRTGMPVSTTHAIVGSVVGVAVLAYGVNGIRWSALVGKIALPLLLSPVLALVLTSVAIQLLRLVQRRYFPDADCACATLEFTPVAASVAMDGTASATLAVPSLGVKVAAQQECAADRTTFLGIGPHHLHWLTSGTTSFARGMNDAPKMVAIVLAAALLRGHSQIRTSAFVLVTLGMVAGSWLAGRRVTRVLAEKITPMGHWEGFLANAVTAMLVLPGAALGLPMSTTHVSSGSILGIGLQERAQVNWRTVREMLLAWLVTLPVAALLGIVVYCGLRAIHLQP
ncbi:MAG: inorganic phosphate transporter [Acidobacteria bacterium]|nr:inorganic phosphate transporter [Acidobacteriota bacterium]MBS1867711.1 inorganic phosphate transporter [Acidobacteriota bacterium]